MTLNVHIAHADIHVDGSLPDVLNRITQLEETLMTALDDARQRLTDKIDAVLTIARELRARIDATEDTTADTAALNADTDRLDAAIAELRTEAQAPPVEEPPVDENPSLGG